MRTPPTAWAVIGAVLGYILMPIDCALRSLCRGDKVFVLSIVSLFLLTIEDKWSETCKLTFG